MPKRTPVNIGNAESKGQWRSITKGKTPPQAQPDTPPHAVASSLAPTPLDVLRPSPALTGGMLTGSAPKGEEASGPALSVAVKGGGRLYILNPQDREWVQENPDEALAQGKAVPSVTTVLRALDKPALVPWAANQAGKRAAEHIAALQRHTDQGDWDAATQVMQEWKRAAKNDRKGRSFLEHDVATAYRDTNARAANRGTEVHALVEDISLGGNPEVPEELSGYIQGFRRFQTDFPELSIVTTEVTVVNEQVGYAGTADAIVSDGHRNYVLDYKTSQTGAIYDSVGLQLAATAGATHILQNDGSREPLPKISSGMGVGLAPDGRYRVVPFKTAEQIQGFYGLVPLWHAQRAQKKTGTRSVTSTADLF